MLNHEGAVCRGSPRLRVVLKSFSGHMVSEDVASMGQRVDEAPRRRVASTNYGKACRDKRVASSEYRVEQSWVVVVAIILRDDCSGESPSQRSWLSACKGKSGKAKVLYFHQTTIRASWCGHEFRSAARTNRRNVSRKLETHAPNNRKAGMQCKKSSYYGPTASRYQYVKY